jgi:hypothetical protein
VYSAIHTQSGEPVALKVFHDCDEDSIIVEQKVQESLFHPFIAQYFGSVNDVGWNALLLEYIE